MQPCRRPISLFLGAALMLCLAVLVACGGDDATLETPNPTASPFSLGATLTIRGQGITLPGGVSYVNQKTECQQEQTSAKGDCVIDFKLLRRGDSYILFDPAVPRVVARRIEPVDEADFRPLLGLIDGTSDSAGAATQAPTPGE